MDKEIVIYLHTRVYIYTQYGILFSYRNKEILPSSTIWIKLKGIMLSKIIYTWKDKYFMILLICGIFKSKQKAPNPSIGRKEKGKKIRFVVAKGGDKGRLEECAQKGANSHL